MGGVKKNFDLRKATRWSLRAQAKALKIATWNNLIAHVQEIVTEHIGNRRVTHPADPYIDMPEERQDYVLGLLPMLGEKYFADVDQTSIAVDDVLENLILLQFREERARGVRDSLPFRRSAGRNISFDAWLQSQAGGNRSTTNLTPSLGPDGPNGESSKPRFEVVIYYQKRQSSQASAGTLSSVGQSHEDGDSDQRGFVQQYVDTSDSEQGQEEGQDGSDKGEKSVQIWPGEEQGPAHSYPAEDQRPAQAEHQESGVDTELDRDEAVMQAPLRISARKRKASERWLQSQEANKYRKHSQPSDPGASGRITRSQGKMRMSEDAATISKTAMSSKATEPKTGRPVRQAKSIRKKSRTAKNKKPIASTRTDETPVQEISSLELSTSLDTAARYVVPIKKLSINITYGPLVQEHQTFPDASGEVTACLCFNKIPLLQKFIMGVVWKASQTFKARFKSPEVHIQIGKNFTSGPREWINIDQASNTADKDFIQALSENLIRRPGGVHEAASIGQLVSYPVNTDSNPYVSAHVKIPFSREERSPGLCSRT
ncbi:hypothetical protein DFH27DRAFT_611008 [Peziza echinospora]|nr:hypothetical protein DFH27DRAFT_611008 [Peziza echinospora]